jgi:hypothetical protein
MPSPNLQRDNYHNVIQKTYGERSFRGIYDVNNNLIFAGFAIPGTDTAIAAWQIRQLNYDVDNNLISILWPEDGNGIASRDYIFIWDNYASLTYA